MENHAVSWLFGISRVLPRCRYYFYCLRVHYYCLSYTHLCIYTHSLSHTYIHLLSLSHAFGFPKHRPNLDIIPIFTMSFHPFMLLPSFYYSCHTLRFLYSISISLGLPSLFTHYTLLSFMQLFESWPNLDNISIVLVYITTVSPIHTYTHSLSHTHTNSLL